MGEVNYEFSVPAKVLMELLYKEGYLHETFKNLEIEEVYQDSMDIIAHRKGGEERVNLLNSIVFKLKGDM